MGTTPIVLDVFPANGSSGIAISPQIKVLFDQEMDESTINSGTFVLTAPDSGIFFGDEFNLIDQPGLDDQDILSSPNYPGYVKGSISFLRVDEDGDPIDESVKDYDGDGNLWRTVAVFKPLKPLGPNAAHTVILSGDEIEDTYNSGIKTRTVFDPYEESVSGTGKLYSSGGYNALLGQKYHVVITSAGATGDATYEWYKDLDPLTVKEGVTVTCERELDNGVKILFDPDGEFEVGDHWSIVCKPGIVLPNNYRWIFNTGSGAIVVPFSSYSASGIEELASTEFETLKVTRITPKDGATNLNPDTIHEIEIEFNKTLDAATVTGSTITIWSESVNGSKNIPSSGVLAKIISVSGNKITVQI